MSETAFEKFRKNFIALQMKAGASDTEIVTAQEVFQKTNLFLTEHQMIQAMPQAALEAMEYAPKLVTSTASYDGMDMDVINQLVDSCKVDQDRKISCALEVARILTGSNESPHTFLDRGKPNAKQVPLRQIYSGQSMAMIQGQAREAIESFGEYSDRVTSDSRLAVSLTILRAHRSLIDRVLPRKAAEDPVVIIKIPSPEVYNLATSQNPVAAVRYSGRQPLITLYRVPDMVNTQPQQIVPLKANDNLVPAGLHADGQVNVGEKVNLLDMTLQANTIGFSSVDWTDLVSDGGSVGSLLLSVTNSVGPVTELYTISTQFLRNAQFTTQTNVQDSADRTANIRTKVNLTAGSLMSNGSASAIFANFANVNVLLEITFNANLNLKNSYVDGAGSIMQSINSTASIAGGVQTTYNTLSFSLVAWSPFLFFSEENMRKTTAAVRTNYKEQEFLIPVGRNFVVDYSLMGQEVGADVTGVTSNVIGIGNSARSVNIIENTLTSVSARLTYEAANPDIDFYTSAANDYAAGTLSLPHVFVGNLDLTSAAVMRESERLSDLHSYVTSRLLALIADGHNKSMYTENFEPGERARYKCVCSGPVAEVLFGIKQYWNTLDDDLERGADQSDYSMKLPNGTQLDVIKSNFEMFANKILMVPVRDAAPTDVTSFGQILDRGTFVGNYTPVSNGAANKRIVANSREIVFPTNPLGYIITVQGLQTQLQILTDGASLS